MSAMGLTPRMSDCKEFIGVYSLMHGYAPTFQEIADNLGLKSKGHVAKIVEALIDRGHLNHTRRQRRSIRLVWD